MAPKAEAVALATLGSLCACALLLHEVASTSNLPPGPAFLAAAGVQVERSSAEPPAVGQRLRSPQEAGEGREGPGGLLAVPLAGLLGALVAAARGAAARARGAVRRRATTKGGYNQTAIVRSGTTVSPLTPEKAAAWLEERCAGLRRIMPQSPEEFEDEADELKWQWARHLLPFMDLGRHSLAGHKYRAITKQREFFEKLRLFKPLAMRYPTMIKRMVVMEWPKKENRNLAINAPWIENEEKIAGFTYEDWAKETAGGTFSSWRTFQVDEIVPGRVVSLTQNGAFVEIGDKTWAYMPTANCSLMPIATPSEVLKLGQDIEAKIVRMGQESQIAGDPKSRHIILSLTDIERVAAWDEIDAALRGEPGTSTIFEVVVKQVRPFGAIVQTKSGLEGLIPNIELADKVGDTGMVGQTVNVELTGAKRDLYKIAQPVKPSDFALTFSYRNVASRELAEKLEEGQVVTAKVIAVRVGSLELEVDGVRCQVKKLDISSEMKFEVADVFTVDEEIKAYVQSVNKESGEVRLSTRALEPKRGMMVANKKVCFEKAEATAKKFFDNEQKAKESVKVAMEEMLIDTKTPRDGPVGFIDVEDLETF